MGLVGRQTIYNKETMDAFLADYATGMLLTECSEKYGIDRQDVWQWSHDDRDGIKARYAEAVYKNMLAQIDKIQRVLEPDSKYVSVDEKGKMESRLAEAKSNAIERSLKLHHRHLRDNPGFQPLDLDISACKKADDIQALIALHGSRLTKTQLESLKMVHEMMLKVEEQKEVKELLIQANERLAKLEGKTNG